jgi:hypothetical protein
VLAKLKMRTQQGILLSRDKTMLKQHGITVIYQPMLRHIFGATSTYEPVRQYINFAK